MKLLFLKPTPEKGIPDGKYLTTFWNHKGVEQESTYIDKGDTVLMGKFKNKKVVVKNIGEDEWGMPTINGKKAVTFRIPKKENLKDIEAAKAAGKTIETYESKVCPKCVMKNCKCKDKKHQDVNEIEEWVLDLAESKYSQFTSKNDIMSIISEKIETTFQPMPKTKAKKGHNGVPEFMTYDSIMAAAQPAPVETPVETPTKPKTPTRPQEDEPFDPFEPQPGPDTKPKALAEKKKIKK